MRLSIVLFCFILFSVAYSSEINREQVFKSSHGNSHNVNDYRQVAISSGNFSYYDFFTKELVDLGHGRPGQTDTTVDINNSSQVAGYGYYEVTYIDDFGIEQTGTFFRAVMADSTDVYNLGHVSREDDNVYARAINDNGDVVGEYLKDNGDARAFYGDKDSGLTDLGLLSNATSMYAVDVNNNSEVVGNGSNRPFHWTSSAGLTEIPLPTGTTSAAAISINNNGVVMLSCSGSGNVKSYTWSKGSGIIDLYEKQYASINDRGILSTSSDQNIYGDEASGDALLLRDSVDFHVDGIVETSFGSLVDINSMTGMMFFDEKYRRPFSILYMGKTIWDELPLQLYFSNVDNVHREFKDHPDGDDTQANVFFNLNTRIYDKRQNGYVTVLRPSGALITFRFTGGNSRSYLTGSGTSTQHKENYNYVLVDLTPGNEDDNEFELQFKSGVIHHFSNGGELVKVSHVDGRSTTVSSMKSTTIDIANNSIITPQFDVDLSWSGSKLDTVTYQSRSGAGTVATTISYDSNDLLKSFSKSHTVPGESYSDSELEVSYEASSNLISQPYGVKETRINLLHVLGDDMSQEVKFNKDSEWDYTVKKGVENSIFSSNLITSNSSFFTKRTGYVDKPYSIQSENYNTLSYGYGNSINSNWLTQINHGHPIYTYYRYVDHGNPGSVDSDLEFELPREIENNSAVPRYKRFISYSGTNRNVKVVETPATLTSSYGDSENLRTTYTRNSLGPDDVDYPTGKVTNVSQLIDNDLNLEVTETTYGPDDTTVLKHRVYKVNPFGKIYHDIVKTSSAGFTIYEKETWPASFGRFSKVEESGGLIVDFEDYEPRGPRRIVNNDGSVEIINYNEHGLVDDKTHYGLKHILKYNELASFVGARVENEYNSSSFVENSLTKDAEGRLATSTDVDSNSSTYSHEYIAHDSSFKTTLINPDNYEEVVVRNRNGQITSVSGNATVPYDVEYKSTSGGGANITKKSYSSSGPTNTVSSFVNMLGQEYLITKSGISGNITKLYDNKGRNWKTIGFGGEEVVRTFDEQTGRVSKIETTKASGNSITTFDYTYHVDSVEAAWFKTLFRTVTNADGVVSVADISTDGMHARYTSDNQLTTVRKTITRSQAEPKVEEITESGNFISTRTYKNGKLDSVVLKNNSQETISNITYGHDLLNRINSKKNEITGHVVNFTPSNKGIITGTSFSRDDGSAFSNSSTLNFRGQTVSHTRGDGFTANSPKDSRGLASSQSGQGEYSVGFSFNDSGVMNSISTHQGGILNINPIVTEFNRNETTGLLDNKKINGVTIDEYVYDPATGKLQTHTRKDLDTQPVITRTYESDTGFLDVLTNTQGSDYDFDYYTNGMIDKITETTTGNVVLVKDFTHYNHNKKADTETFPHIPGVEIDYDYHPDHKKLEYIYLKNGSTVLTTTQLVYNSSEQLWKIIKGDVEVELTYVSGQPYLVDETTYRVSGNIVFKTDKDYRIDTGFLSKITATEHLSGNVLFESKNTSFDADFKKNEISLTFPKLFSDPIVSTITYDSEDQVETVTPRMNGSIVANRSRSFDWDGIGNEKDQGIILADVFNQTTYRQEGNEMTVAVKAPNDVIVSVNNKKAERTGDYASVEFTVDNSSGPTSTPITLRAIKSTRGQGVSDKMFTLTGVVHSYASTDTHSYNGGQKRSDTKYDFVYNGEDQLLEIASKAGGAGNDAYDTNGKIVCTYDVFNRRTEKKSYLWNSVSDIWTLTKTRKYVYDDWNLIAEFDGNDNLVKSYMWGLDISGTPQGAGGIGGLLAVTEHSGSSETHYFPFGTDRDIYGYLDEDGEIVAAYDYDVFGELLAEIGPKGKDFFHRYQTKPYDREVGLVYFGYRYYEPRTRKMLTRDPLGEIASNSANMHAYCKNDPFNNYELNGGKVKAAYPLDDIIANHLSRWIGDHKNGYTSGTMKKKIYDDVRGLIIARMFESSTTFTIKGKTKDEVLKNFKIHLDARIKIIKNALDKKVSFGRKMGKVYDIPMSPVQPYYEAINDPINAIGCLACTTYVFYGGIGGAEGDDATKRKLKENEEWIPGDWGYIENMNHPEWNKKSKVKWKLGLEGENIVYLGNSKKSGNVYWGHIKQPLVVLPLDKWEDYMRKEFVAKDGVTVADPKIRLEVTYPTIGLEVIKKESDE